MYVFSSAQGAHPSEALLLVMVPALSEPLKVFPTCGSDQFRSPYLQGSYKKLFVPREFEDSVKGH